jgi:hypothetical protein
MIFISTSQKKKSGFGVQKYDIIFSIDWPKITTRPEKTEQPEISVGHVIKPMAFMCVNILRLDTSSLPTELALNSGYRRPNQFGLLIDIHL